MKKRNWVMALLAASVVVSGVARAEVSEIKIAQQYGISYLPLMVMEQQQLIEKQAGALGIKDLKVGWAKFAGGNVMTDALISGDLHFGSGGVGVLLTLWDKTQGSIAVKGVGAMNSMPLYLNTRNPNIKTIKDFTDKDKIALPAVKVSNQAIYLQMAAEQVFGPGQQSKLDRLTVSMSHPDAQAQLLSGMSEINSHFTAPPFQYQELKNPSIHTVLNSYDVLGGPHTFNLVFTTTKFRDANPKTYEAFTKALAEAIDYINTDKKGAAEIYLKVSKDKTPVDDILAMLNDPNIKFTTTPQNVLKLAAYLHKIGRLKHQPASWKDMFFSNAYSQPGS